jgi:hypothetical protein
VRPWPPIARQPLERQIGGDALVTRKAARHAVWRSDLIRGRLRSAVINLAWLRLSAGGGTVPLTTRTVAYAGQDTALTGELHWDTGGAPRPGMLLIHGSLATTRPAGPGALQARVLACHGALDPHVPMADVTGFAEEMDRAGADWQLIIYGGALHGFTHQHAVPGAVPGVAYHRLADERSFAATRAFLAETLS